MITALRVHNLAIVESAEVFFDENLNIITGETGAGKSLLVDALHLILGGRASTDLIRTGTDEASVEAVFENIAIDDVLEDVGISPDSDGALLIRRTINRLGKSRVWINGALSTVGQLEKIARSLVDISGQHEHVSLLRPELHLGLLDAYAANAELRGQYRRAFSALEARQKERNALTLDGASREERMDYLRFQLDEIEAVNPTPGELDTLERRRKELDSVDRQKRILSEVDQILYSGENCAADQIAAAENSLKSIAQLSEEAADWFASISSLRIELNETARDIARHAEALAEDPEELEKVMEREEAIRRLTRKHGGSIESVLDFRDKMRAEIEAFESHDEKIAELDEAIDVMGKEVLRLAEAISETRVTAARNFSSSVEAELKKLAMGGTVFDVSLRPHDRTGSLKIDENFVSPSGLETCEFLIAPNAGEAIKPLAKIASGGELSRVMLAIKRVLANADPVFTYIFDEVDTGMSGAAADAVGRLLHEVSRDRQVIVVTHLPQIAAFGTTHFTVRKEADASDGRIRTKIYRLDKDGTERELARMLAGSQITAAAIINARAMIESCRTAFPSFPPAAAPSQSSVQTELFHPKR